MSDIRSHARKQPKQYPFLPRLFSVENAATYLGVDKTRIEAWIREGRIKTCRLPGPGDGKYLRGTRIKREELDRYISDGIEV